MGNICSRSKNPPEAEAFSRPGRVLGSGADPAAAVASPRASVPASAQKQKSNWQSPGRTLGAGSGAGGGGADDADARAKAALAAQKRAEATSKNANKGKLGSKLAAQKAQTHAQTLNEASREERAARDADGVSAARRWD